MSFEWARLLDYADDLRRAADAEQADADAAEAGWRTAISRAYYAVFHLARERYGQYWIDRHPLHARRTSHHDLIAAYRAKAPYVGDPEARMATNVIAGYLAYLKALRETADYEPRMERPRETASRATTVLAEQKAPCGGWSGTESR